MEQKQRTAVKDELVMGDALRLHRCPYCSIDSPNITIYGAGVVASNDYREQNTKVWAMYRCNRCGNILLASANQNRGKITQLLPTPETFDDSIPERANYYLQQASNSIKISPSASIVVCASSVDAMLKAKGYKEGSLNSRIRKAAQEHLITDAMAEWAHYIRLEANEERHADEDAPLPTSDDAQHCFDFAKALGHFLFVLPSRVQKGLAEAKQDAKTTT